MRRSSLLWPAVLLFLGGSVWTHQRSRLGELQASSANLTTRLSERQGVQDDLERRLSVAEAATAEAERVRTSASLAASDAVRQIDQLSSAQQFDRPPAELPSWEPDSPYVWLRKDQLPHLPFQPFDQDGALNNRLVEVLTLDPAESRALNTRLQTIVRHFQNLEATHVETTDQHLAGIANQEGTPITILAHPPVEAGQAASEKFTAEIRRVLGEQRSELVLGSGEDWLNSTFGNGGTQPATYSVLLRPNGTYNVAVKRGWGWMNTTAPDWKTLQYYVPPYLLPHFTVLKPAEP
jgi:hypothetical protein